MIKVRHLENVFGFQEKKMVYKGLNVMKKKLLFSLLTSLLTMNLVADEELTECDKVYVNIEECLFAQDGIFVNINNTWFQTSGIQHDAQGYYVSSRPDNFSWICRCGHVNSYWYVICQKCGRRRD
ncbi:MAG: hypothetical protein V4494_00555 [Chlamydiota bacterium]